MISPWVDPLLFAMSCLSGAGLLFALWLTCPADRPTRKSTLLLTILTITALTAAAFALIAVLAGQSSAIWGAAASVAGLYVLLVVMPSPAVGRCVLAAGQLARCRTGRRLGMVSVAGSCPFVALGLFYFQIEPSAELTEELAAAIENTIVPPLAVVDSPLTTDLGRPIRVLLMPADAGTPTPGRLARVDELLTRHQLHDQVMYLPMGWQDTNCHGFVFTGGRYWLGGAQVNAILDDNGYEQVSVAQLDDLAVYRDPSGAIAHTGIVRGLAADGVVLVESKWGQGGRFIHRHDRHSYPDAECTFYRSPRGGHLLQGLPPGQSPARPTTDLVTRNAR
jgi:hypothetical protein